MQPPSGFSPHTRKSPVTNPWEPLYVCVGEGLLRLGFYLDQQHCNGRGILHGGVIAALADNAMGLSLAGQLAFEEGPPARGLVTSSLSVDYVGMAQLGNWIEISPRVVKVGRGSGVVDALVTAEREIIARANASFRVLT